MRANLIMICIYLLLTLFSCSKIQSDAIAEKSENCIYLEFDGFKGPFHQKYDLLVKINQESSLRKVDSFLRDEKGDMYYGSARPVEWTITVYYSNKSGGKGEFLCDLIHTTDGEDVLQYGNIVGQQMYANPEFAQFLKNYVKVDLIGDYSGPVDQKIYEKLIK